MSDSPYLPPPFASGHRRPSYATVAAGTSSNSHSRQPSAATARDSYIHPSRDGQIMAGMSRGYDHDATIGNTRRTGTGSGDPPPGRELPSWGHDGLNCPNHADHHDFFTPSYLRPSRYVRRLRQDHERHVAELRDLARRHQTPRPQPLSTSSSTTSLKQMGSGHFHRSVVHDVVERIPPPSAEDEKLHQLPGRWSEDDKWNGLEILADGTEVRFNGITKTSDEAAAVRSDHWMPKEVGMYYFEVTILSRGKDGLIGIGFSSRKANLNRLPGWEAESWAYHGDDGYVFSCTASGKAYGPRFASQDVIGCGVNFRTGHAFFTKNGQYLGTAFTGVKGDRLFPSVGMKKPGEHLRINFGKTPFVFDIDRMVEQERQSILADIKKTDVKDLHPPDDENALVHNLIGQYLAHEGYVETAKAFTRDIQEQQQSFSDGSQPCQLTSDEDDINALQRQRIRRSILDGNIDKALKYQSSYYPHLFDTERNKDIYFRLRCRKFIEMMRRYSELQNAASSPTTVIKSVESLGSNGHANVAVDDEDADDPPDTQMELDDQLHRETSKSLESPTGDDVDMDASQELPPKMQFMKAGELLTAAIQYGQELSQEFGRDQRPMVKKQLEDIFAVMAYQNVQASPISHHFDAQGRVQIAEDVNGAILVSLGKPSSAALEKLCAQTEVLLDETAARTGGATAFVNVRQDFLQG